MVVPAADGGAARGSVPSFGTPERAVAALAHAVRYGSWLTSPADSVPDLPGIDADAARTLLARFRGPDDPPRALTDAELSGLLAWYGIPWVYRVIGSVDEAVAAADEIGHPGARGGLVRPAAAGRHVRDGRAHAAVALKSVDDSLRHGV